MTRPLGDNRWLAGKLAKLTTSMQFTPLALDDYPIARRMSPEALAHRCGSEQLAAEYLELAQQYEAWRRRHVDTLFDRQQAESA